MAVASDLGDWEVRTGVAIGERPFDWGALRDGLDRDWVVRSGIGEFTAAVRFGKGIV